MELKKNQTVTVSVTDQNNLGYGVGRIDGKVIFIADTVEGDRVEAKIIKVTPSYYVGKAEKRLTDSPYRCAPSCAVSGQCGGCMYANTRYTHEAELKKRRVRAAFQKVGLPDVAVADVITVHTERYRNKVQIPVAVENGTVKFGYYAPHSHRIVAMDSCTLHLACFDRPIAALKSFFASHLDDAEHLRHLFLRAGEGAQGTELMVCLIADRNLIHADALVKTMTEQFPEIRSIWYNHNDTDGNVILGDTFRKLYGEDEITDTLCGQQFGISPASFYQVNRPAAEAAYRKIAELAGDLSGKRLLDLYCGIGTIGLTLKKLCHADRLTGVEVIPQAVENAVKNAARNGVTDTEFFCGDADYGNGELLRQADVVVVDPPRKGCSESLLARIVDAGIKTLLYMSCDPETLARDAAYLLKNGYTMSEVSPFDLFPRTGHVEAVVLFSRK